MYGTIAELPTVRERFAEELVSRGVVRPEEPAALLKAGMDEFQRIREAVLSRGVVAAPVPDLNITTNGTQVASRGVGPGGPMLDTLRPERRCWLRATSPTRS
jgi:hypothetical protein